MSLIRIEYGALASSQVMNDNFEYLDNKISSVSEVVGSNNSAVYSSIASINSLISSTADKLRPIGQPLIRLDDTIFEDEIRLEGAEVSRTTYSVLFEKYGVLYGAGDGTTTFKLPDFRNRTLWGADSFGYISAGLPNITGYLDVFTSNGVQQNGALSKNISSERNPGGGNELGWGTIQFDASRSSSVYGNSTTVQPPAINVRVVTRYK
jgi:hypothetical protein